MSFLAPITALIAAGVAVPALVALYFLKLRRRQVVVPSTLLWKRAIQDLQVNAPFQRIRRNLLLLLQLLLLAGLLLALARPTFRGQAQPGRRVVIVVDHSGSMNATDAPGGGSRLEQAKAAALDLIQSLDATGGSASATAGAMVVSFAEQVRVVQPFTTDLSLLRSAVRSIEPTDQRSQLEEALRLVEPYALEGGEGSDNLVVYVLSDGRLHDADRLAFRGAELRYVRMGSPDAAAADNLAFVALSAQRDYERPHRVNVFARLANFGPAPVETHVQLIVDGQTSRVSPVSVPLATADGPGVRSLQFELVASESALIEVRHNHADQLDADNRAAILLEPARRLRVLLVTEGNVFLERAIDSVGVRQRVNMDPRKYENQEPSTLVRRGWDDPAATDAGFDLIVFDGYSPPAPPAVPSLSWGAAPPIDGLSIVAPAQAAEAASAQVILDWRRDHPLLHRVLLDDVLIQDPGRVVMPMSGLVLATAQSGPVVAEVGHDGLRHIVTSFGVLQSNWPFYVSFPVFIQNAVQYLASGGRADAGLAYRPGEVAAVPVERDGRVVWRGPVALSASATGGRAVLPAFTRAGLYEATGDLGPPWDRLAVNLLDGIESDVRTVDQLQVGTTPVAGQAQAAVIRREVWWWFAAGALAMLMIEWLVYTRRMHL